MDKWMRLYGGVSRAVAVVALSLCLACDSDDPALGPDVDSQGQDGTKRPPVVIQATYVDLRGEPLPGGMVTMTVYFATAVPTVVDSAVTDSAGQVRFVVTDTTIADRSLSGSAELQFKREDVGCCNTGVRWYADLKKDSSYVATVNRAPRVIGGPLAIELGAYGSWTGDLTQFVDDDNPPSTFDPQLLSFVVTDGTATYQDLDAHSWEFWIAVSDAEPFYTSWRDSLRVTIKCLGDACR